MKKKSTKKKIKETAKEVAKGVGIWLSYMTCCTAALVIIGLLYMKKEE